MIPDSERLDATKPSLLVVTGLPGTGKSTVAEAIAGMLRVSVLGHDWAMSGLRPYGQIQAALDEMGSGHRIVGWSILCALARAQLRHGRSVILDGVARAPEIDACRDLARDEGARSAVVVTNCSDIAVHRSRVEGRQRLIPDWYELDWDQVARSRESWEQPGNADLYLDTVGSWEGTLSLLRLHFT
jgi:predicted kinase